jgi:hypothetical protein
MIVAVARKLIERGRRECAVGRIRDEDIAESIKSPAEIMLGYTNFDAKMSNSL